MAFACTALLDATLFAVPKTEKPLLSLRLFSLPAFACTALLDTTLFAVPKTEKPLLSLRLFSLAGLRLHGSAFFAVPIQKKLRFFWMRAFAL